MDETLRKALEALRLVRDCRMTLRDRVVVEAAIAAIEQHKPVQSELPTKVCAILYNGVLQPTIYQSEAEAAQEVQRRQDEYPHDKAPRAVVAMWIEQHKPVVRMPPFGSKRAAALALYRPPFKFRMGYIYDAGGHMVADQDGFGEGSKVFDSVAARVRGWGRIGYMPDAEALQDEVGVVIAEALTAYWSNAEVWGLTIGEQG